LCNYVDVYNNDFITDEIEFMSGIATPSEVLRFGLKAGDVLLTKNSESWTDIAVPAHVELSLPDTICGYHLAIVRGHITKFKSRYSFRLLCSIAAN